MTTTAPPLGHRPRPAPHRPAPHRPDLRIRTYAARLCLAPGGRLHLPAREDTEAVWCLVDGRAALLDRPDRPHGVLTPGDVLLVPRGEPLHLHAGPTGATLLHLTVRP